MSRSISFIINPAAGFGRTGRKLKNLIREIRAHSLDAKIYLTRHPLHATGLTKEALRKGAEKLIVIGGDGTLNEVVNGYFDKDGKPHNSNAAIGIIPSGTGSDFVRGLGHNRDIHEDIDFVMNGNIKMTDVGLVEAHDANGLPVKRYFINVASLGMSGLVAGFMKTVTRRFGSKSAYFLATVQAIRVFRPATLLTNSDGVMKTIENCSLLSFANGKFFGSGMKIAPDAKIDDGLLDVVSIQDLSALFFLANGYRVYQGTHLALDNVNVSQKAECYVETLTKEPIYIETDGELFAELPAKFSIKKKLLPMVL